MRDCVKAKSHKCFSILVTLSRVYIINSHNTVTTTSHNNVILNKKESRSAIHTHSANIRNTFIATQLTASVCPSSTCKHSSDLRLQIRLVLSDDPDTKKSSELDFRYSSVRGAILKINGISVDWSKPSLCIEIKSTDHSTSAKILRHPITCL